MADMAEAFRLALVDQQAEASREKERADALAKRVEELERMLAGWADDHWEDHEPEKALWREAKRIAERRAGRKA